MPLPPPQYDDLFAGESKTFTLVLPDEDENGDAVDPSDWAMEFSIGARAGAEPDVTVSMDYAGSNSFTAELTAAQTFGLLGGYDAPREMYFEARRTDSGEEYVACWGVLTVNWGVAES